MNPFFIIVTPTHKRPTELARAVQSVCTQTYTEYIHIIINDSPEWDYEAIEQDIAEDKKIIYIKNEKNSGKNTSLNQALTYIHKNDIRGYVIFLDDDDWLGQNALHDIAHVLKAHKNIEWLVTERVLIGKEKNTRENNQLVKYNYFWDYLLRKKLTGDKTHSISTNLLFSKSKSFFSKHVKNGEEWFFFCQLSPIFYYTPLPSTLTRGYAIDGLNEDMRRMYVQNTKFLFKEKQNIKSYIYLIVRFIFIAFYKI